MNINKEFDFEETMYYKQVFCIKLYYILAIGVLS